MRGRRADLPAPDRVGPAEPVLPVTRSVRDRTRRPLQALRRGSDDAIWHDAGRGDRASHSPGLGACRMRLRPGQARRGGTGLSERRRVRGDERRDGRGARRVLPPREHRARAGGRLSGQCSPRQSGRKAEAQGDRSSRQDIPRARAELKTALHLHLDPHKGSGCGWGASFFGVEIVRLQWREAQRVSSPF